MQSAETQKYFQGLLPRIVWASAVGLVALFLAFELLPLPESVAPLENVSFSQNQKETGGQRVALPDNWRSFPDRQMKPGIYRATIHPPADPENWAVYIPNISGQIKVTLNGQQLLQGGYFSGNVIADQGVPFFAPIPVGPDTPGAMTLEVTLQPGGKLVGYLSQIYAGPADALKTSYDWHYVRAVLLPTVVSLWQYLLIALLLLLWYRRRSERAALICAILLLLSSLHGIPVFFPNQTQLGDAIALFGLVTNFWLTAMGLLFVYELSERSLPVPEKLIFLLPGFATIAYFVFPPDIFHYVDLFLVVPFSVGVTIWIVVVLLRTAFLEKRWEAQIILMSILAACCLVVHDVLVITNATPEKNFLHFRIVYILILPSLSIMFVLRLIDSLDEMDTLAGTLEERIQQNELQLREAFEKRSQREGQQTLSEERQRIMRDMHDGLGGQLMSIIAMSSNRDTSSEVIEKSARAALDDLRTMINSLAVEDDITGVLGAFRERAEQQLALQGIELDWNMIDIPPIEGLTPSGALHIMRIMQEAVTNAAKHSKGDKVTIRFSLVSDKPKKLKIEIDDNGVGPGEDVGKGLGLKNMADRAENLGGEFDVEFSDHGTKVWLSIPTNLTLRDRSDPR